MAKCPHCGEQVRPGQDRCFACGQRLAARRSAGRGRPTNPLIFVIAGAVALIAVVGILVAIPKRGKESKVRAQRAETQRVQDSVRKANRAEQSAASSDKEVERLNNELADLEARFEMVKRQTMPGNPTPEQQKLAGQIATEIARLRQEVQRLVFVPKEQRAAAADSVRAGTRHARALISDLTRAPKK